MTKKLRSIPNKTAKREKNKRQASVGNHRSAFRHQLDIFAEDLATRRTLYSSRSLLQDYQREVIRRARKILKSK